MPKKGLLKNGVRTKRKIGNAIEKTGKVVEIGGVKVETESGGTEIEEIETPIEIKTSKETKIQTETERGNEIVIGLERVGEMMREETGEILFRLKGLYTRRNEEKAMEIRTMMKEVVKPW